jgi:hypothetical protein
MNAANCVRRKSFDITNPYRNIEGTRPKVEMIPAHYNDM